MPGDGPRRFRTLDGLRGLGALAVMALHIGSFGPASFFGGRFGRGYLAVDLFFVLSGVVLAEAYSGRLSRGLGPGGLLRVRVVRLYPLYVLPMVVAACMKLAHIRFGGNAQNWTPAGVLGSLGLSLLMLPTPFFHELYPLIATAWSLLYELGVNLLWAGSRPWLTTRTLLCAAALAGSGLAFLARDQGVGGGMFWGWQQAGLGTCRVLYSFSAGLLIHGVDRSRLPRVSPWLLLGLAGAALCGEPPEAWGPAYDLAVVLALWPACVLLAAASEPARAWEARIFAFLGDASYGIYMIHIQAVSWAYQAVRLLRLEPGPWCGVAAMAAVVAAAGLLDRVWDRPARRWLAARLLGAQPGHGAGA